MRQPDSKIRFVNGSIVLPSSLGTNNEGIIAGQLMPGHDYLEAYLFWRELEPKQDQWDWSTVDKMLALMKPHKQKMLPFPWVMYAPDWFVKSDRYVPLEEAHTGKKVDLLSLWAPGTWWAYDHYYKQMAAKYGEQIDAILVALPSSDYGEAGYPMGATSFTTGTGFGELFAQKPDSWHEGMWCADPCAMKSFREAMARRYHSLSRLNQSWGTRYTRWDQLELMRIEDRKQCPQRWLDLIEWYYQSQVDAMITAVKIVRKHFPKAYLEVALGHGCELPQYGVDRTALCRAISKFQNVGIRSTHACCNRGTPPQAYWFYKRMTPVCQRYGVGFGTEPPGGDLTADEMKRQLFEDSSVGVNLLYTYFQNWHALPDVARQWSNASRLPERSKVSVGVIYPNTQMSLDMAQFPVAQIELFDALRPAVDMDVVDENMIRWGMLPQYRVLINSSAWAYPKECLDALWLWIQKGGMLITRSGAALQDLQQHAWPTGELSVDQSLPVGRGRIVRLDDSDISHWSNAIAQLLRQMAANQPNLHGVNPKHDRKWRTQFSDGWLSFDPVSLRTRWE